MAWERTGFVLVGIGALIAHAGRSHLSATLVLGLAMLVCGTAIGVLWAPRRYRDIMREAGAGRVPMPQQAALRLLAAGVVLAAVATALLL